MSPEEARAEHKVSTGGMSREEELGLQSCFPAEAGVRGEGQACPPQGLWRAPVLGPSSDTCPPELTQESSTVQTSHGLPEALPGEKHLAEGKGRRGLTEADLLSSQSCGFPRQEEDTPEAGRT